MMSSLQIPLIDGAEQHLKSGNFIHVGIARNLFYTKKLGSNVSIERIKKVPRCGGLSELS